MHVQAAHLAAREGPELSDEERSMCENYSVQVCMHASIHLAPSWSRSLLCPQIMSILAGSMCADCSLLLHSCSCSMSESGMVLLITPLGSQCCPYTG